MSLYTFTDTVYQLTLTVPKPYKIRGDCYNEILRAESVQKLVQLISVALHSSDAADHRFLGDHTGQLAVSFYHL